MGSITIGTLSTVMPRFKRASSNHQLRRLIDGHAGYWITRSSRAMTG
jgi:hypothetical protein